MSYIYPEYTLAENTFNELWAIDDGSWGFYGYGLDCKRHDAFKYKDTTIKNLCYYWTKKSDWFKIVLDDYEGVFSKESNCIYPNSTHSMYGDQKPSDTRFDDILKTLKLELKTDDYIILKWDNKIIFKLHKICPQYIGSICENTKKLNQLIKEDYEEENMSRREILSNRDNDSWW